MTVVAQQHEIAGQMAVDDALGMRCGQRVQHLQQHAHRLAQRPRRALRAGLRQRRALHVLEDEVGPAVGLVGLEHRHDVRVHQPARRARALQPAGHAGRLERRRQHLDDHAAVQPRIVGQPGGGVFVAGQYSQQVETRDALAGWGGRVQCGDRPATAARKPPCRDTGPLSSGADALSAPDAAMSGDCPCSAPCKSRRLMSNWRP